MKTFLLCESAEHAEVVDTFIMEHLRERDGAQGSSWSGVWTDGTRYGVLWADPGSSLFGTPEDDASVVLAEDTDESWTLFVPEPEVPVEPA